MKQKERQKIEVHRTTEGTIFEVAFLVLTVIVWAIIIWQVSKAPNVIATHFDMNGHPNGYGSPWGLMFPCIMTTVVGACLLAAAYFPHTINVPVRLTSALNRLFESRLNSLENGTMTASLYACITFLESPGFLTGFTPVSVTHSASGSEVMTGMVRPQPGSAILVARDMIAESSCAF